MHDLISMGFSHTIEARLKAKLVVTPNGCVEWTGAIRGTFGHGHLSRGTRGAGNEAAHRVAWMIANGPIPEGMHVLHRCDNPPCCNPDHLFIGTHADNMRDMNSKGRHRGPSGESHPSVKLTDDQISELRTVGHSVGNYAGVGRMFGVSKQYARSLLLNTKRCG